MVSEFLRKYQDQLLKKKDELVSELKETETEIRKQEKFLKAISEDVAEPFSAFSPHVTDRSKQDRIDAQSKIMNDLQLQRTSLDQKIQDTDDEILEVERSLKEVIEKIDNAPVTEDKSQTASPDDGMTYATSETDNLSETYVNDNQETDIGHNPGPRDISENSANPNPTVLRDIRNAYSLLPADPMRAKMILKQYINE